MEHNVTFPVPLVIVCMARQKSRVLPLETNILECGTTLYRHVKVNANLNKLYYSRLLLLVSFHFI